MIYEREISHGDHKSREIQRGRVQRDRRPSVIGVAGRRIRCRRRDVFRAGRIGLGIAPERGDTALDFSISAASAAEESARSFLLAIGAPCAAVGGDRALDLQAEHEARKADIVSKGRPHADRYANRIARANKLGSALDARPETRGADSSATKMWYAGVAKPAREIRKSSSGWVSEIGFRYSTDGQSAAMKLRPRRLDGPSARLAELPSVCRGRGVNIGWFNFACGTVPMATKNERRSE